MCADGFLPCGFNQEVFCAECQMVFVLCISCIVCVAFFPEDLLCFERFRPKARDM